MSVILLISFQLATEAGIATAMTEAERNRLEELLGDDLEIEVSLDMLGELHFFLPGCTFSMRYNCMATPRKESYC